MLESLKHATLTCKCPSSVFFRFLIGPTQHTVNRFWNTLAIEEEIFAMYFQNLVKSNLMYILVCTVDIVIENMEVDANFSTYVSG